jgi:hypothetical protein
LADARAAAEKMLKDRLGLDEHTLCGLVYGVYVPDQLNAVFSGKNLGFSFCPGATQL